MMTCAMCGNNMNDKIKHTGTIKSIEGNHIQVMIVQTSAFSTCAVATYCNAAESKEKIIDVYDVKAPADYQVGQEVTVWTFEKVGMNAVWMAFGIPFVVLVVFLFAAYRLWHDDLIAASVGIGALMVYYLILYFLRQQLGSKFAFHIES
jgi:sigma-E factor negative regulatory protein RseC